VQALVDDLRAALGVQAPADECPTVPVDSPASQTDTQGLPTNRVPPIAYTQTLPVRRSARGSRRRLATAAVILTVLAIGAVVAFAIGHWGAPSPSSGQTDQELLAVARPPPHAAARDASPVPAQPDRGSPPTDLAPPDEGQSSRASAKPVRKQLAKRRTSLKHHRDRRGTAKRSKKSQKIEVEPVTGSKKSKKNEVEDLADGV
jgi:hypothetical protein